MSARLRPAAILALGLWIGGCSPAPGLVGEWQGIVGGEVDDGDPAVAALVVRPGHCGATTPSTFCTATLIAPRVLLTAAHCRDTAPVPQSMAAHFGADVGDGGERVAVLQFEAHPDYDDETHAFDLALVLLAEEAPVAPVALPQLPMTMADEGATVRAVGFGETHDPGEPVGIKRTGTMLISAVADGSFEATPAPAMSCTGDSGGPVFLTRGDDEELVGVTASGDFACEEWALNVRVDAALDGFITPYLDAVGDLPLGWPEDAIPLDALCDQDCEVDADCPAALACLAGPGQPGRCTLPGLPPGAFTDECDGDAGCASKTCADPWPGAAAPCRCLEPCDEMPQPDDDTGDDDTGDDDTSGDDDDEGGDGGCEASCEVGRTQRFPVAAAWILAATLLLRRRR